MNRAERRRMQKQAVKNNMVVPLRVVNQTDEQVAAQTGVKITQLKSYLSAREEEIKKFAVLEAQEKLWKAEDYIAVANILISIYAIKMSRKNREHTKDLINRMLENLKSC